MPPAAAPASPRSPAIRLRRSDVAGPGIRRRKHGKGFQYLNDDGSRIFYNYDQSGNEPFTERDTLYGTNGAAYQQVTSWDGGSTTYTNL